MLKISYAACPSLSQLISVQFARLKIANFPYPLSFSTPAQGDPFTDPETKVFQTVDGEDLVIVACTVFD